MSSSPQKARLGQLSAALQAAPYIGVMFQNKMLSSHLTHIASYSFAHEAYLAKSSLEASEIPVFLTDEYTINIDWTYSNALGGVKIFVPNKYSVIAKEILYSDFSDCLNSEELSTKCKKCESENLSNYTFGKTQAFLIFIFLGFPLYYFKHGLKCNDCGNFNKT